METVYKHQKPLNYYRWGGAKLIQITGSTYHTERANRLLARFDRCAQTWAITNIGEAQDNGVDYLVAVDIS